MKTEQIIILVVAFFLGMLLLNMVKNVCGCELKEGFDDDVEKTRAFNLIKDHCPNTDHNEFKDSLDNPCGQIGFGKSATFPPIFNEKNEFRDESYEQLKSDSCTDVQTILDNCDNCKGWREDVRILNRGCDPAAGGGGTTCESAGSEAVLCDGRGYLSLIQSNPGGTSCGGEGAPGCVETCCNPPSQSTYVISSNPSIEFALVDGSSSSLIQACNHMKGTTACGVPTGTLPQDYYKCKDSMGADSHDCGDFTVGQPCPSEDKGNLCADDKTCQGNTCVGSWALISRFGGDFRSACEEATWITDCGTQVVNLPNSYYQCDDSDGCGTLEQNPHKIKCTSVERDDGTRYWGTACIHGAPCSEESADGVCEVGNQAENREHTQDLCAEVSCTAPQVCSGGVCVCPHPETQYGASCESLREINIRVGSEDNHDGDPILNDGQRLYFLDHDDLVNHGLISEIQQIYDSQLELTNVQLFPNIRNMLTKKFGYYGGDGLCHPWTNSLTSSDVDTLITSGVNMCYTLSGYCSDPTRQ